mmetsp:Transcript_67144/g.133061  ORF Transcript_67144/g.133061 Transcript_67144/m.133061 type:complete len:212 (-) Transcript_67144:238-873(-)
MDMNGGAHDHALITALLAVLLLWARHRVRWEAVQRVSMLQQMLPCLPLLLLALVILGWRCGAVRQDGARTSNVQVWQHDELCAVLLRVAPRGCGVDKFAAEVCHGLHRRRCVPLDLRVVDGVVDRPLVRGLPPRLLGTLLHDLIVRLAKDGDGVGRRSYEVEASADGGAPLLDYRHWPAPYPLTYDVTVRQDGCRAAQKDCIEVRKENVEA